MCDFFSKVGGVSVDISAGGTSMYIHNYQIHNVLNEYRKQLISRPAEESKRRSEPSASTGRDRVNISKNGQRQALMDQVSADIVDRITKQGGRNRFEGALGAVLHYPDPQMHNGSADEFTYTLIDEQNRKSTGTFEIQTLKTAIGGREDSSGNPTRATQSLDRAQGAGNNPGSE
jgi:hypothetical protein